MLFTLFIIWLQFVYVSLHFTNEFIWVLLSCCMFLDSILETFLILLICLLISIHVSYLYLFSIDINDCLAWLVVFLGALILKILWFLPLLQVLLEWLLEVLGGDFNFLWCGLFLGVDQLFLFICCKAQFVWIGYFPRLRSLDLAKTIRFCIYWLWSLLKREPLHRRFLKSLCWLPEAEPRLI